MSILYTEFVWCLIEDIYFSSVHKVFISFVARLVFNPLVVFHRCDLSYSTNNQVLFKQVQFVRFL